MAANNSDMKVVFGAMTFGEPGQPTSRVLTTEDAGPILDVFQRYNHKEIDTARVYNTGTSEELLAAVDWQKRGLVMATKLYPTVGSFIESQDSYTHKPADVRRGLLNSLKALKTDKVDLWYLHGPDRNTPYEDTLREVNKLHQEGYFERLGVSNYMSWEVAQMCEICKKHGWIMPSVYQGIYHALQRSIEGELFPCLRNYGISLYVYQPLAGGFLTGRYKRDQAEVGADSPFDKDSVHGDWHRTRYWNDAYFTALEAMQAAGEKHGLTIGEVALRWLKYHSELKQELGDAIVIGASSVKHLETNLIDLAKGPLPDDVVQAVDSAWPLVKGAAVKYWY
ncbi:hypothetical protein AJ80_04693 [Polytolypa hystricis UAMH7299]|uniref:D-xylose reductase [NAD(P)H] n=1 Tax=Polytolypa hystricis (strain UAMH7299) TaxID=1447883 RepID=A0A2B7Y9U9_POLH7|nr:hypothetical protein AJ80_04693 [Polytolypa hystricis UAMH7299]